MKKILFIPILFCSCIWASGQHTNPELRVEVNNFITISICEGTFAQQAQYIARRTTQPAYGTEFDSAFFDKAIVLLENLSLQKNDSIIIRDLKKWRSFLSSRGSIILKDQYTAFLKQTERYLIEVKYISSCDQYDILQLEKISLRVVKETYGTRKKKVEVPPGSFYMIAMKQPLY